MRIAETVFAVTVLLTALAATAVQAEPRTQSGKPAACKAPWGEPFGLGETIEVHVTDAKGNMVTVTYQCTEHDWVKVSKLRAPGGGMLHIAPGNLRRAP